VADLTAYELSLLYGKGWTTARKLLSQGHVGIEPADAARLNPYCAGVEAERWTEGFKQALKSRGKPFGTPGGSGWRRAVPR